ncbi:hypothetical protein EB118_23260 [bacterium]|nr:hypothetical protein [bacterium]
MNERIQELAEQCWDQRLDGRHFDQEMFAELVVQECLLSLEPDLYSKEIDYEFEQRFYKRCRDKIIKHFGVEQ